MSDITVGQLGELIAQAQAGRVTRENLQAFLRDPNNGFVADGNNFPSLALAANLIPKGLEVIEDVEPSQFQVKDLELVPFLHEGKRPINGDTMRQRAVELNANLGLADAKFVLDHQDEIPVEFRGKYLVFTGTLLRYSGGYPRVAALFWYGSRWCLNFDWLAYDWDARGRLLRCK